MYEYEYGSMFVNLVKTHNYFYFIDVMCMSEKSYLKKRKPNLGKIYSIPKLCIQNNLPNTTKYENKCFFLYLNSKFEYKIKKMKNKNIVFLNRIGS